jgi:hypothetical protein
MDYLALIRSSVHKDIQVKDKGIRKTGQEFTESDLDNHNHFGNAGRIEFNLL